jgi:hypothetical protein
MQTETRIAELEGQLKEAESQIDAQDNESFDFTRHLDAALLAALKARKVASGDELIILNADGTPWEPLA